MAGKRTTAAKSEKTAALLNAAGAKAAKIRSDMDAEGLPAGIYNPVTAAEGLPAQMDAEAVPAAESDPEPEKKAKVSRIRAKKEVPEELDRSASAESIFRKLIEFGQKFNVDNDNDFREAVRNYAEESVLIIKMRNQVDQDGLTTWKSYKTGDQMVAHPLIQEISRHVDCANRTLSTISDILKNRGAKREETGEDLDRFRMLAHG